MADYHARIVVRNILMPFSFLPPKNRLLGGPAVHLCRSGDRPVGLNEAEAKKGKIEYDLIRQEITEVDRAVVEREESGFVRVLVARHDKIL